MPELKRRTLAGLATALAGSVVAGANAQSNTKGAPPVTDPMLIKKLDAVFNAHMDAELAGDLDKTLATMAPNPHLVNIPTMVGGQGLGGVRTFYAKRLIGQFFPPDVKFESISCTHSEERCDLQYRIVHKTGAALDPRQGLPARPGHRLMMRRAPR